jgi:hypothetical protein
LQGIMASPSDNIFTNLEEDESRSVEESEMGSELESFIVDDGPYARGDKPRIQPELDELTKRTEIAATNAGLWSLHAEETLTSGRGPSGPQFTSTILARSSKQKIVSKNSTEAELIALSDKIDVVNKCDEFLCEQGYKHSDVPVILQDNMSTISLVTTGGGKPRTKHLRTRQYAVKEMIDKKEIKVMYLPTGEMIADVLTKPLQGTLLKHFVRELTNYDPGDGKKSGQP